MRPTPARAACAAHAAVASLKARCEWTTTTHSKMMRSRLESGWHVSRTRSPSVSFWTSMASKKDSPAVLVEREGAFATVTLNRPEQLNALSDEIMRALVEAMKE